MIEDKPPLDELMHFGVKGMRWGVRRNTSSVSRFRRAANRNSTQNLGEQPLPKKPTISKGKVISGVAVAAGAVLATSLLAGKGHITTSSFLEATNAVTVRKGSKILNELGITVS